MSSYVARIDKRSIAFGMLWTVLPGVAGARKEIKKLGSDFKASSYVSLPVEGGRPKTGLLTDAALIEKGASRSAASSAAALLSIVFRGQIQNAVFGIQLTKGKVAFIGFVDGYPLIGFDKVVSLDALDNVTGEYLKELQPDQLGSVKFYGTEGLFAGRDVSPADKGWFATVPKKALATARLRRAKTRVVLWAGVALAVIAAGFAVEAYDAHQKEAQKKAVRPLIDPNTLYTQSVGTYLAEVGYPAAFVASTVIERVNKLPLFHEGWRMQGGVCKPATDAVSCVVSWANTDGGTFLSFSQSGLPGVPVYRTEYKEGMATLDILFDVPFKAPRGVKLDKLMTRDMFAIGYGTTAQTMKEAGLNINFGKPVVVGLPPSPAGAAPITESSVKAPVREGSWALSGDWMFYSSLTNMPANMTLDAIEVGVSGESISMNATGKYYVKN
jgi:hypothetical protein